MVSSRNQREWMRTIINNIKEDINNERDKMERLRNNIIDRENGIEVYTINLRRIKDDFDFYDEPETQKQQGIRTKSEWFKDEIRRKEEDIEYCKKDIKGDKVNQLRVKNGMIARTYILNVLEENINKALEKDIHVFDNLEEIWIDEDTVTSDDEPAYSPNQWKEIKGSEYHE